MSLRLIRELHERLMQGVRGQHATPGEFRRSQNWIGPPGCTLSSAKYVPPPAEYLMDCLGLLELFFHDQSLPALIHIALCHYQFEAIHPFIDGNGRVGRLLITLLLIEKKVLASPLLCLSAFFERTRDEYYCQLFNVSADSRWTDWLLYFLKGVTLQAKDALNRVENINHLMNGWLSKIAKWPSASAIPAKIIRSLAATPFLNIHKMASQLGVAFTTVQRAVQKLESLGILTQLPHLGRTRVYCARDLSRLLEA